MHFLFFNRRIAEVTAFTASRMPTRLFSASSSSIINDRLFPEEINIIYDSKCNVCKMEIDFLSKRDTTKINIGAPKLKMTDIEGDRYNPQDPENGGITYEKGLAAIHAITADGRVIKGVPVFALAYEQVKLGWLFKVTTWPVAKPVVDMLYNIFAKFRTNLTRGASIDVLVKEYEAKKILQRKIDDSNCDICETKES